MSDELTKASMNLCLVGLNSKSIPLGKFRINVIRKLILDRNEISKCSRNLNNTDIEHQKLATLSFFNVDVSLIFLNKIFKNGLGFIPQIDPWKRETIYSTLAILTLNSLKKETNKL